MKAFDSLSMKTINKIGLLNVCFFTGLWLIFIFLPLDLIYSNPDEFVSVNVWELLSYGFEYVLLGLLCFNIISIFIFVLGSAISNNIFLCLSFLVPICIWVNSMFLVGSYGEFDGRNNIRIDTSSLTSIFQLVFICLVGAFFIFFRKNIKFLMKAMLALLFVLLTTNAIQLYGVSGNKIEPKDDDVFFTYSKENPNVLMILLDEYQSDYFKNILTDELKESLEGFIWYQDAASNFPTTIVSLAAMFSGQVYDNKLPIKEFYSNLSSKSIPNIIHANNGMVSGFGKNFQQYLFPRESIVEFELIDNKYKSNYIALVNYSLFKSAPDILKPNVYNDEKWFFKADEDNDPYASLSSGQGHYFKELDYMSKRKINVINDYPMTFKFYHSMLTHSPTVFDSNCYPVGVIESSLKNKSAEGLCAFNKILGVIEHLKRSGIYDNTMVIITSDHGSVYTPNTFNDPYPYSKSASTLLIKPFSSDEDFVIDKFPAQLSDLPKTIATALSIDNYYPGEDLLESKKAVRDFRYFNHYIWSKEFFDWSKKYVPPIRQYTIKGRLSDANNWISKNSDIKQMPCDLKVMFNQSESSYYYHDIGLSSIEKWGRWSNGSKVELVVLKNSNCNPSYIELNLSAFVPNPNIPQKAKVYINDIHMGKINFKHGEKLPRTYRFDLLSNLNNELVIQFEIENPVSPEGVGLNADTRMLGLGFIDMMLVSKK
ncbi:DUF7024 domain-containing protein [Endozoicomonas lisbonensis]|uniref:Sulfatase N-terminal domain-containing protein n=1 Tax=Endozoicomonas lisbonensis TaxID=3120522 RepID=A0ABV2SML1_9GAMM